ncbi:MAG: dihydrofolate reductase family protein [Actinomycetota bacterium]
MGRLIFQTSMTLDGFMTGADQTAKEPLGTDGERLHEWGFSSDPQDRAYAEPLLSSGAAMIVGRVTYDHSLPFWGADGPSGAARLPVFVVTHEAPAESPENGVYTFVTDGIESALNQAQDAAGDEDVVIVGGAKIGRAYIAARLVDELQIHVVPVLFGSGTRMFEDMDIDHRWLEPIRVVDRPLATHIHYRVVR